MTYVSTNAGACRPAELLPVWSPRRGEDGVAESAISRCALLRPARRGDVYALARVSREARRADSCRLPELGRAGRDPEAPRLIERGAPSHRVAAHPLRVDRIEWPEAATAPS